MSALQPDDAKSAETVKVLMVGAGGIGCELLKNLVLTGFKNIDVIDLDTIELSNLNRQFLFQKVHVGRPKAEVAKESALRFKPDANITHYHTSIQSAEFNVNFFKQYSLVLNALDNRAARNHVNRMCLAADVPLVESGSSGYLGQVTVIKKGLSECYECRPKPTQKSFPGCTIRNTPSEMIHCIVWAKHLFNQLFGEADPDEDVSPDFADPEQNESEDNTVQSEPHANGNGKPTGDEQNGVDGNLDGNVARISTRKWAVDNSYDPELLFQKFFHDDIKYLLSMENLWKKRTPPQVLQWDKMSEMVPSGSNETAAPRIQTQQMWSPLKCRDVFQSAVVALKGRLTAQPEGSVLVWDKDDDTAMDFVTACANLRAFIFSIPMTSPFQVKSMAGNIIPAIATTNAIIAGVIVMEALKILTNQVDKCNTVYLGKKPNFRGRLLVPATLDPPNPKCYVCSDKQEVYVRLNTKTFTVGALEEKVLKATLNMIAPDVELDGTGTILISSEEGETAELRPKCLAEFNVGDGCRLSCDDFLQQFNLRLIVMHTEILPSGLDFEIVSDIRDLKAEPEADATAHNTSDGDDLMLIGSPKGIKRAASPMGTDEAKKAKVQ